MAKQTLQEAIEDVNKAAGALKRAVKDELRPKVERLAMEMQKIINRINGK